MSPKNNYFAKKAEALNRFKVAESKVQEEFKKWLLFRRQLNFTPPGTKISNPNVSLIQSWVPKVLKPTPENNKINFGNPLHFVDSDESFDEMMGILRDTTEMAIDTESNNDHSYLGMISIVQVSTPRHDFIIDPFALSDRIQFEFKIIMEDPLKIKVLSGCDNDILGFQRCFKIFPVGVIEVQFMHQLADDEAMANDSRAKLDNMALKYFEKQELNYLTDKDKDITTHADWRIRPLNEMPQTMVVYARADTHILLRLYNKLKEKILKTGVIAAAQKSNQLLSKLSYKFPKKPIAEEEVRQFGTSLSSSDRILLEAIVTWRNDYCMRFDENPQYYMPPKFLAQLVQKKPTDEEGVQSLYKQYQHAVEHPLGKCLPRLMSFLEVGVEYANQLNSKACNNCGQNGHLAWGCLKPFSNENVKQYMSLHPESKTAVNRSRRHGKAKNRKLRAEAANEDK